MGSSPELTVRKGFFLSTAQFTYCGQNPALVVESFREFWAPVDQPMRGFVNI